MNNNGIIKALTLQGTSMIKLYKHLPDGCIKTNPVRGPGIKQYELKADIGGALFTGYEHSSNIVLTSLKRTYHEEELTSLQKMAAKCYTYPFGGFDFIFKLDIHGPANHKKIQELLSNHKMEHYILSTVSEGATDLKIGDVKDFSKPSFISFILELQELDMS